MPEGPATGRVEAKRRALTTPSTAPASSARWWRGSIWIRDRRRVLPENSGSCANRFLRNTRPLLPRIWTRTRARGRRDSPARTGRADSDTRHDQRWRERPRLGGLGSGAGQDSGVVHAIVGSPTATPTPTETAAKSAASIVAAAARCCDSERLHAVRAHGATRGERDVQRGRRNRGANLTRFSLRPPLGPHIPVHRASELEVLAVQRLNLDGRTAVRPIVAQAGRGRLPEHLVSCRRHAR